MVYAEKNKMEERRNIRAKPNESEPHEPGRTTVLCVSTKHCTEEAGCLNSGPVMKGGAETSEYISCVLSGGSGGVVKLEKERMIGK